MTRNQEIAGIILQQLGGNRFKAMTGADNFSAIDNGIIFSIKGCRAINKIKITLNVMDIYDMEFIKMPSIM